MNRTEICHRSVRPVGLAAGLALLIAAAALSGTVTPGAYAAGDATQATCPNEVLTGFASYLPDCRGYELVTPPYKEGLAVEALNNLQFFVSADGQHAIGDSLGSLAGTEDTGFTLGTVGAVYQFSRTAAGWSTTALDPPASEHPGHKGVNFDGASSDLARSVWSLSSPAEVPSFQSEEGLTGRKLYIRQPAGTFVEVGPETATEEPGDGAVGAANDLSRVLVSVPSGGSPSKLWPGDETLAGSSLYEYVGVGNPRPALVGVTTAGTQISQCGTELGRKGETYNAVSTSGETVLFTANDIEACEEEGVSGAAPAVSELYARLGGTRTVDVSEPSSEDCGECDTETAVRRSAEFQGASADGSRVFFTTTQELLSGAHGKNLFEYDSGAPAGHRVALVSTGASPAGVMSVVRISEDGSRVYFVAHGVLSGPNGEGKAPTEGEGEERNLYVYDAVSHVISFIATLETGEDEGKALEGCETLSGELFSKCEEIVNSEKIWKASDSRAAETTSDGRFFVFASSVDLTGSEDTSTVPQLFEYDAEAGTLTRVSIGQGGFNANGNINDQGDESRILDAPKIAKPEYTSVDMPESANSRLSLVADGSVFFESAESLTPLAGSGFPSAEPGYPNVYEFRGGTVYLISDGQDVANISSEGPGAYTPAVALLGVAPSGADAFFRTADRLTPADGDTQADWYDARIGGGFAVPRSEGCTEETCQGPLSPVPLLPGPGGSETTAGGDNLAAPSTVASKAKKSPTRAQKLARALADCRARHTRRRERRACEVRVHRQYAAKASPAHRDRSGTGGSSAQRRRSNRHNLPRTASRR